MKTKVFNQPNQLTNLGCLPLAVLKDGRTLQQIIDDISNEKILESRVMRLHNSGFGIAHIATKCKITTGKVKHIINFDKLGLSYLKLNKKI